MERDLPRDFAHEASGKLALQEDLPSVGWVGLIFAAFMLAALTLFFFAPPLGDTPSVAVNDMGSPGVDHSR